MIKLFLFVFALLPVASFASAITLKNKLSEATPHSYLVTEQSRNFTFLRIFEKKGNLLILEEVTIPEENFSSRKIGWKEWFERGAPGHTSWMLSKVNLQTGNIEEVYSCDHEAWVDVSEYSSFMATLLNLHFYPVAENERRRIGLPPGYGKPDLRPFWQPRLVVDGKSLSAVFFQSWKARWPTDGSELAKKTIEVYLPEISDAHFPTYFPYWLEVEGKIGSAKIRVVDSGMESHSLRTHFPQRKPTILNHGRWVNDNYVIDLKNPSHISSFMVVAEESDSPFCKSVPLPATFHQLGDVTKITIKTEDLAPLLSEQEKYHFVITSNDGPFALLETKQFLVPKN